MRELHEKRMMFVRVLEPFSGTRVPDAVARLLTWAEGGGLAEGHWLGYDIPLPIRRA